MLRDSDLLLRPYRPGDRDALIRLADNPEVSRGLADRFPCPYRPEDADAWIELTSTEERPLNFAVFWRDSFIGGAGLIPLTDTHHGTAEFGYWLGQPYWGRGLATRAAALLIAYAWAELPFIRLQAEVFAWNLASMRVLEKNGFEREGVLRRHITKRGQVFDAVIYARLRDGDS